MLQKFPSDKIKVRKNTLSFLSQALTHQSFTFTLQSQGFHSISFLLKFIILFNKKHGLFYFKISLLSKLKQ